MIKELILSEIETRDIKGEIRRRLTPLNLSVEQYTVLYVIGGFEECTISYIDKNTHFMGPSLSRIIKALEDYGFIKKVFARDARCKAFKITVKGKNILKRGNKLMDAA